MMRSSSNRQAGSTPEPLDGVLAVDGTLHPTPRQRGRDAGEQQSDVEPEGPGAHVGQVVAQLDRRAGVVLGQDLGQSGDAWADETTKVEVGQIAEDVLGDLR